MLAGSSAILPLIVENVTVNNKVTNLRGTATVSVDAHRFLFWTMGDITVNDAKAGIRNVSAPLIFAPSPAGTKSAATVGADWFLFGLPKGTPYRIDVTVGDN